MLVRWTASYPRIEERELEAGVLGRSAGRSTAAATPYRRDFTFCGLFGALPW